MAYLRCYLISLAMALLTVAGARADTAESVARVRGYVKSHNSYARVIGPRGALLERFTAPLSEGLDIIGFRIRTGAGPDSTTITLVIYEEVLDLTPEYVTSMAVARGIEGMIYFELPATFPVTAGTNYLLGLESLPADNNVWCSQNNGVTDPYPAGTQLIGGLENANEDFVFDVLSPRGCYNPRCRPFPKPPESLAVMTITGNPAPGSVATITLTSPVTMDLRKGPIVAPITMTSYTMTVGFSALVDSGGFSSFMSMSGSGQFAAYTFNGEPISASTFVVESGSGSINWNTGQVTSEVQVRVSNPSFPDLHALANGTAVVNFAQGTVNIPGGANAFEIDLVAVPSLSEWGMVVLLILLLLLAVRRFKAIRRSAVTV